MSNAAASIRNDLKAAGFSLKLFSIRTSPGTGSVTVEIKDAGIAKSRVEKIAGRHEVVRRDEGSGEILSGANTFVSVRYAAASLEAARTEITARLRAGVRKFGSLRVDGEGAASRHTWHVWSDDGSHLLQISPHDGGAVAELLAERGELAAVLAVAWGFSAELDERRARICVALDLLRRAERQLGSCAAASTVAETDQAMNEAEAQLRLALRELEG